MLHTATCNVESDLLKTETQICLVFILMLGSRSGIPTSCYSFIILVLTCLDALIKGVPRGCSLVPQFLIDLRCEALCHPVVVLGQVGIVFTSGELGIGCHCCERNRGIVTGPGEDVFLCK